MYLGYVPKSNGKSSGHIKHLAKKDECDDEAHLGNR